MHTSRRSQASLGVAAATGVAAFGYRVLSLHGLPNDHFMHMAWAQQVLAGDLPGRDFVEPGMPLVIALSAAAQYVWNVPFSEVLLTAAMMGIAAAATCLVTERLTSSRVAGVAAAILETALQPRLYSYPKILVPAVLLLLLQRYTARPSAARLAALAVWTAAAVLLRHDLGVDSFITISLALAVFHWPGRRVLLRAQLRYASMLVLVLLPYVIGVQWTQGWDEHLREGYEFSKSEVLTPVYAPERVPFMGAGSAWAAAWDREAAAGAVFYALQASPIVLVLLLLSRREGRTRGEVTVSLAAVLLLTLYRFVILRHPLVGRLADLAALFGIVGVLSTVGLLRLARQTSARRPVLGGTLGAATAVFAAMSCGAVWVLGNVGESIRDTHVLDGRMVDRFRSVAEGGTVWPWRTYWPAGELPAAIAYLNECTQPVDRLLVTWPAAEYYYFTRRPFAAGHALFLWPNAFLSVRDQRLMLARLDAQRVPVALLNESTYDRFARAYPMLDAYLGAYYVRVASFRIYDDSEIAIAVRRDLTPGRLYGEEGWPCDLAPSQLTAKQYK